MPRTSPAKQRRKRRPGRPRRSCSNTGDSLIFDANNNHVRDPQERVLVSVAAGKAMVFLSDGFGPDRQGIRRERDLRPGRLERLPGDDQYRCQWRDHHYPRRRRPVHTDGTAKRLDRRSDHRRPGFGRSGRWQECQQRADRVGALHVDAGAERRVAFCYGRLLPDTERCEVWVAGNPLHPRVHPAGRCERRQHHECSTGKQAASDIEAGDGGADQSGVGNGGTGGSVVGLTVVNSPGGFQPGDRQGRVIGSRQRRLGRQFIPEFDHVPDNFSVARIILPRLRWRFQCRHRRQRRLGGEHDHQHARRWIEPGRRGRNRGSGEREEHDRGSRRPDRRLDDPLAGEPGRSSRRALIGGILTCRRHGRQRRRNVRRPGGGIVNSTN